MKNKALIFFLGLAFISCSLRGKNPCSLSDSTLVYLHKIDSMIKLEHIRKKDKEWKMNNYDEPSLLEAENDTYRFIYNSAFGKSKVIRVEYYKGSYHAIIKNFYGYTGDPNTKIDITEFELTNEQWNNIVNGLVELNFWIYNPNDNREGFDGSMWSLEGYKTKKDPCTFKNFHSVSRWSPIDTTFIKMCKLLIDLDPDTNIMK